MVVNNEFNNTAQTEDASTKCGETEDSVEHSDHNTGGSDPPQPNDTESMPNIRHPSPIEEEGEEKAAFSSTNPCQDYSVHPAEQVDIEEHCDVSQGDMIGDSVVAHEPPATEEHDIQHNKSHHRSFKKSFSFLKKFAEKIHKKDSSPLPKGSTIKNDKSKLEDEQVEKNAQDEVLKEPVGNLAESLEHGNASPLENIDNESHKSHKTSAFIESSEVPAIRVESGTPDSDEPHENSNLHLETENDGTYSGTVEANYKEDPLQDQKLPGKVATAIKKGKTRKSVMWNLKKRLRSRGHAVPESEELHGTQLSDRARVEKEDEESWIPEPSLKNDDEIQDVLVDRSSSDSLTRLNEKRSQNTEDEDDKMIYDKIEYPGSRFTNKTVEDNDNLFGVVIHETGHLAEKSVSRSYSVKLHILDMETGQYFPRRHADDGNRTLPPLMTQFCKLTWNRAPCWDEVLVVDEKCSYIMEETSSVILLFELCCHDLNKAAEGHEAGKVPEMESLAWSFLLMSSHNGQSKRGHRMQLQLYRPPRMTPRIRPKWASSTENEKKEHPNEGKADIESSIKWSRLPGQSCRIPNSQCLSLSAGKKGCTALAFSHNGLYMAAACHDEDSFPVKIFKIPSGTLLKTISHHSGIIYSLHWSMDDNLLLSASSDATALIAFINSDSFMILPHPSFLYTAVFHPCHPSIAVTGCFDHVMRIWSLPLKPDRIPLLMLELDGHLGYVTSLCFHTDGSLLYSADSKGAVGIWEGDWKQGTVTLKRLFSLSEMAGVVINHLMLYPGGRRLLLCCRDSQMVMLDTKMLGVMQTYKGFLSFKEAVGCTITPCGTYILSGSEDSIVYVWNTETGELVARYNSLSFARTVCCVEFHPHDNYVAFASVEKQAPVQVYFYKKSDSDSDAIMLVPRQVRDASGSWYLRRPSVSDLELENDIKAFYNPVRRRATLEMDPGESEKWHSVLRKIDAVIAMAKYPLRAAAPFGYKQEHELEAEMWEKPRNGSYHTETKTKAKADKAFNSGKE
ncbi:unnamed protein product [Darwinula stevensoni]|uniref:Uncharacterized protein n=1 Tax=Darwinula stevensoni TaxID=69355 RepID=A0A7R8X0Y3_9CRUS|nr:unnamed protein product [Darwinula stevensoni]CAG0881695.1 unnamed protein product [Darwinula stevensoni]